MSNIEQVSRPGFLKNRGIFVFTIDRQGRIKTSNQATVASKDQKIRIFLNGVIYNHNGDQLVEGFYLHGVDYINKVEGSFIIFLIDEAGFYILTDKVNSKKAFYACLDNVWYVSNDIDALPRDKCQLSLDGIASYLANGFMLNDLTLFREIKSTKLARVYGYKNGELFSYPYWEFTFSNPPYSADQYDKYQQELESLLIQSVKRCYAAVSAASLSLSAGHDSRTILGILHDKIKAPNISCFSYALEEDPGSHTDAALSKLLAARFGYPHQIIRAYQGDLIALLRANAREGKCLSNFCDELDVWHFLAARNQFFDVFVGEKCLGKINIKLGSKFDVLASLAILHSSALLFLKKFISQRLYGQLCLSVDRLADDLFDSTKAIPDPLEKSHYLYVNQRLDHFLMPWREYFTAQVGFVHNPFLDGAVLEFYKSLPLELRKGKFLYTNTVKTMFPDLFSVGIADLSGSAVNWHRELQKHKTELISLVLGTESRLAEIIPKSELLNSIKLHDSWIIKLQESANKAFNLIRRSKFIDRTLTNFGLRRPPLGSLVGSDKLLIRLLLIWIYLSPTSSNN